jgi:SAM-dependent methyltransferase
MISATDYDPIAETYAAGVDGRSWNALYERPAMVALLPEVRGLTALDAGCGPGWYAELLAGRGAEVIAVDASERMTALARARLGTSARVLTADMGQLEGLVGDATLDLVLSSLAVHYVGNLDRLFAEWARILRPGGLLLFSTHHPLYDLERLRDGYLGTELVEEHWAWLGPMRFYRRPISAITEPLSATGFAIERLVEPKPGPEFRDADPKHFESLSRWPTFIILRACKLRPPVPSNDSRL